ncbi:MAG TPA: efflux RND transporter periplasmic adaptor subunit [Steroidobacteraceae bacterium]|nr:efflux RND transporter periplasmic adaptor subunit [Steroidobacteraceae bacterium]
MNDISRSTDFDLSPVQLREPWWRRSGVATHRSRAIAIAVVLLGLGALAALGWYLAHRTAASQFNRGAFRFRAASTVGISTVARQDVPIYYDALGTVTPLATAVVQAQVSGVMTKVYYKEGEIVKAGEPLVQIDPRPFQMAFEQAQGNLARDQANLANQQVIVERDRVLIKQDSIAQQQLDTDFATQKQLAATVATDRAALDSSKLNLTWSTVSAPISGRVGIRPVDVGNYVTSSLANGVATITQLQPIDVLYTLPAEDIAHIQARLRAGAQLPTTVLDQSRTTILATGAFLTMDNQVDTSTGTVRLKSRFDNKDGLLFPQQFVNVRLLVDTLKGAVVVPAAAVRHGPNGDYVYVVTPDQTAHVELVKTGPSVDDKISIASGLNGGERVVTEGGDRLVDGATVRLAGESEAQFSRGLGGTAGAAPWRRGAAGSAGSAGAGKRWHGHRRSQGAGEAGSAQSGG